MVDDYVEYLQQLNNNLKRKGVETNVTLKEATLAKDVNTLEQYFYYNKVLVTCDSNYKIVDALGYKNKSLYDFLREYFYDNYKEEWLLRSKDITIQPKEAGKYVKNVSVVSPLEVKVFTESLNLEQPLVKKDTTTFSKDEMEDDDFVYDYEDVEQEVNVKESVDTPKEPEIKPLQLNIEPIELTVKEKIDNELKEITPLYKSLMIDDEDVDIDYTDEEPTLSELNLDYGPDEEEEESLDYDEYSDSEIAELLKETDDEIEAYSQPKVIDYKSRKTTIEADKIVDLVNRGMSALFAAFC